MVVTIRFNGVQAAFSFWAKVKSVAIVGFASATREQVRKSNADEVWSLNMLHSSSNLRKIFPLNIDRLFELHPFWMLKKEWYTMTADHWGWLTKIKHHYPIYLIEEHPEIHNGVRYPLEPIIEKYLPRVWRGDERARYFTCSLCYMIALAIYEGFERIEIYGFEMGSDTEYVYQKSGAEFWLGIASQYADVYIPKSSTLLRSKLYGFEGGQLIDEATIEDHRAYYVEQREELAAQKLKPDKWIDLQLIRGAAKLCEDIQDKGDTISRQVLESYKNIFGTKSTKLAAEINALSSRAIERKRLNGGDIEELSEDAFRAWQYMYRYDGAYQLATKFIQICDLQDPDKELKNRFKWLEYSTKKEAGVDPTGNV